MCILRRSLLVTFVALGHAGRGEAQLRSAAVEQMKAAATIRVSVGGTRFVGRLEGITGDTLQLRIGNASQRVALKEIEALGARGHATKTGALVGGGLGALAVGVFLGTVIAATCEADRCDTAGATIVGGLVGGVGGALAGGMVGALIPVWRRRYP